jgi:1-deoxy-D-xylulose-5-phosphate reductoisomerase
LAYAALKTGRSAPTILNASNEIAVQAFLDGKIGFRMIDQVIARVMDKSPIRELSDIDAIFECDQEARALSLEIILA